jgi:hypothetical protein
MEDVEDRAEQVRITREEAPRGDKQRITIERTRRVSHVIEQPKGRLGAGGLERMARGMIGSQESSRLPEIDEEEEEEEDNYERETAARGKGKGKAPVPKPKSLSKPAAHHIPISTATSAAAAKTSSSSSSSSAAAKKQKPAASKAPAAKTTPPPSTPKKRSRMAPKHIPKRKRTKRGMAGGGEITESFGVYIHRVLKQVGDPGRFVGGKTAS